MEQHNVTISFKVRTITFGSDYCLKHCIHNYRPTTVYSKESKPLKQKTKMRIESEDITAINATAFMKITAQEKNQIIAM